MNIPVLKGASYILAHTPDMVIHNGTTQTTERITNPDSDYLKELPKSLRTFEQAVDYPPNQVYIGNMTPEELKQIEAPWYDKKAENAARFGTYGEIMPQDEFIVLLKIVDAFDLVDLETGFTESVRTKLSNHPLFKNDAEKLKPGVELADIEKNVSEHHAEPIYNDNKLVGCVKRAHDIDQNLNAHVIYENLVVKASGVLALRNLIAKYDIDVTEIDYVVECSEEACGDMNQRGGGNFAKAIAESCGCINASGSDTRGFCAAPVHSLIEASSLVKAGAYGNVIVVAGGATAKLGMNGKDHVKKGVPIVEDVLGGFAVMIGRDDGESPIFNTDLIGKHTVGTGSSPQAVITSLVANPLSASGLKITDIDKYSVEMQNPDITKPAGAGDVPEANYKMIAALAVMRKEIEKTAINDFIKDHGMMGWAPTQGHIPSGVPYLGFAKKELTEGKLNKVMVIGKGSLFLGRMTNLFDGVSIVLERNDGKASSIPATMSAVKKKKVGLTILGSELGVDNLVKGAELAASKDSSFDIVLIGTKVKTKLELIEVSDETEMYKKMEDLLDSGYIDGCVTMHYNFPIGVSTVGKVVTPGVGAEMFIATTTGTAATNRVEAMVKNTLNGIITAKAMGIKEPTIGIANLDGARQVEHALSNLNSKGYKINFAESVRADGGAVMRGNDLLCGSVDIMVTDTLTGNLLTKVFSSFTTGGNFESSGYGYGPGIGEDYNRLVLILSRASGSPVVANALIYAAKLAEGNVLSVARSEFAKASQAGLKDILASLNKTSGVSKAEATKEAPAKEVVTEEISGIDIMELEEAVATLQNEGVYAESGMGCTGPIVLVNSAKIAKAREILIKAGYIKE